jgi:hypothetical protein
MATKRKKAKRAKRKTAAGAALAEVQSVAKRLQRELEKRRRTASGTATKIEGDLRALAGMLSKRASAVRADVEKHIRALRRDLARQARASGLTGTRRRAARKKKK